MQKELHKLPVINLVLWEEEGNMEITEDRMHRLQKSQIHSGAAVAVRAEMEVVSVRRLLIGRPLPIFFCLSQDPQFVMGCLSCRPLRVGQECSQEEVGKIAEPF